MRLAIFAILALSGAQSAAAAESPAAVHSAVFIEREGYAGHAGTRMVERATTLGKGDRVVTILDWQATRDGNAATVTLALPRHLAFQRSSADNEDVSVDGGRSWGKLGTLSIRDAYGVRLAAPEDVTNLRWQVNGPKGRITYSALVR
ncbi:MAG: hypothetical protein PHE36_10880 [Novosphingobium sp.]|nr:hypothetical protein [Novosphingobium sp.]